MCQIDQREDTVNFDAIRRVLREVFAKNHGGASDHPTGARVNSHNSATSGSITGQDIMSSG